MSQLMSLSADLWREVGPDFEGNIGLLCGEGFAVINCDNLQAIQTVQAWLDGLGLRVPTVITPTKNGRHFYLKVTGVPQDFTFSPLSASVGAGDLRCRNCYVVAPPSHLPAGSYRFAPDGPGIEALPGLRVLTWSEISWLCEG
jgi:Bifunctional DNA primase/polymerase, N-terminal